MLSLNQLNDDSDEVQDVIVTRLIPGLLLQPLCLKKLFLNKAALRTTTVVALAEFVAVSALEVLEIGHNPIAAPGLIAICEALVEQRTMRRLSFYACPGLSGKELMSKIRASVKPSSQYGSCTCTPVDMIYLTLFFIRSRPLQHVDAPTNYFETVLYWPAQVCGPRTAAARCRAPVQFLFGAIAACAMAQRNQSELHTVVVAQLHLSRCSK